MRVLLKTIEAEEGNLLVRKNGERICISKCRPFIGFYEDRETIPILGANSIIRKSYFSIVVSKGNDFTRNVDLDYLKSVSGFEITFLIQRQDGVYEKIHLDDLVPVDIELDGDFIFESRKAKDLLLRFI